MNARIKLIHMMPKGIEPGYEAATPQNCVMDAGYWTDPKGLVRITRCGDKVKLVTKKGQYLLPKHPSQNYWHGVCNGTKVHVILSPIVGKVIFWPKQTAKSS